MSNEACANCYFNLDNKCKRYPPKELLGEFHKGQYSGTEYQYTAIFNTPIQPSITLYSWCGEWKSRT